MNMLVLLIVASLATWQTVEVLHHSKIAAPLRIKALVLAKGSPFEVWLAELFLCPFCLSHWVAAIWVIVIFLSHYCTPLWLFPCTAAVTRLANLGNDYFYGVQRSPKVSDEDQSN